MKKNRKLTSAAAPADGTEFSARRAASVQRAEHDAELVRRFNDGDETAFAEIVLRYREKVFAIACALLRNRADAEEIVQDTFVRAHRGLHAFRGDASLATWLHKIAQNQARNRYWYFHRRARHATLSLDFPLDETGSATFADLVQCHAAGPARETTTNEFVALVAKCMRRLEPVHREVLDLRNVLHRSYGEIARELAIEVGTVKSRIARARECLRALMAEACPEFTPEAAPADWLDLTPARSSPRLAHAR